MQRLCEMREKMVSIVEKCLQKHGGGESYFDELDAMVKNDAELMASYIDYIINKENIHSIIVSGEIGHKIRELQLNGLINQYFNLVTVNGGLRKWWRCVEDIDISDIICRKFIFLDDSFYSGKTATKVKHAVLNNGGEIVKTYVFYDGSPIRHDDVVSLYRYYKK